jgi:hypothetical protein
VDGFDLAFYDLDLVDDVIGSVDGFHVEDCGDEVSFDSVLLDLEGCDHGEEAEDGGSAGELWHAGALEGYVFGEGDF